MPRPAVGTKTTVALAAAVVALLGVIGGVVLSGHLGSRPAASSSPAPPMRPAGLNDVVQNLIAKGLSDRVAKWLTEPGCDTPGFSVTPQDFTNEGTALKDSLKNAWGILKTKCTASSDGFPEFLQVLPVDVIARDSDNGHAWLITLQGWKSIPTGGDYLCFTGQGHPVYDLPGLTSYTQGFSAGDAKCVPGAPHVSVPAPAPPAVAAPAGPGPAQQQTTTVVAAPAPRTTPVNNPAPPQQQPAGPPTTQQAAPPPAPAPPQTWGETIDDSYYGGTWARTDPNDGHWYPHGSRPGNAAYWYPDGLGVAIDCVSSAASYVVRFADGHYETWSWWAHVTDNKWVPTAVLSNIYTDGQNGITHC